MEVLKGIHADSDVFITFNAGVLVEVLFVFLKSINLVIAS
jgi:hypothetical protein